MPTIIIQITGKVQGVFFRAFVREKAIKLGISGWVENQLDGSVQVLAQGSDEQLDQLVHACRTGPARSRVDRVELQDIEQGKLRGFEIRG